MRKIIIDGKEYFQHEQCDIDKLPKIYFDKDILTKHNFTDLFEKFKKDEKK